MTACVYQMYVLYVCIICTLCMCISNVGITCVRYVCVYQM